MDRKTFAIGTLSVTAVILLSALVLLSQLPAAQPAFGIGQVMAGGDYIMLSGQLQQSSELLYVVDVAVNQLNVYGYDQNRGGLRIVQKINLKKLLPGPPKKRSRRR
jgi:hypothetical protein